MSRNNRPRSDTNRAKPTQRVMLGFGKKIDLHTHTTHSDGDLTPEGLARLAISDGVRLLAVTDHENFEGSRQAGTHATNGLSVLGGCAEFNTRIHNGSRSHKVHLLAYGVPTQGQEEIEGALAATYPTRLQQALETMAILKGIGFSVDHIPSEIDGKTVTKGQIADLAFKHPENKEIIERLGLATPGELRRKHLEGRSPLTRHNINAGDLIEVIRRHGGHVVVAHPGLPLGNKIVSDEVLEKLFEAGAEGVEVTHPAHTPEEMSRIAEFARTHDLVPTIGTDFHSHRQRTPQYAREFAATCLERLKHMEDRSGFANLLWRSMNHRQE